MEDVVPVLAGSVTTAQLSLDSPQQGQGFKEFMHINYLA